MKHLKHVRRTNNFQKRQTIASFYTINKAKLMKIKKKYILLLQTIMNSLYLYANQGNKQKRYSIGIQK